MYGHYKNARNKSWEVLIACGINSLPVDLWKIAKHFDLHIHPYSKTNLIGLLKEDVSRGDGFIVYLDGKKEIFINDKIHCRNRRRFTVAHELGHGILNHEISQVHYRNSEIDSQTDMQELEANVFFRKKCPHARNCTCCFDIHTAAEIMSPAMSAANQQKSERSGYRSSAGEINLICIQQKEK